MGQRTACKEEACEDPAYCRGWCTRHYRRWKRHGDPTVNLNRRAKRECIVEDCGRTAYCRGWCIMHYERWRRHGSPDVKLNLWGASRAARFWAKVNKEGPAPRDRSDLGHCWPWGGAVTNGGYGVFERRTAHCVAYELAVGLIPDGFEVDHLCESLLCVNPAHLEAITHLENVRRARRPRSAQAAKTHCPQGHPYDELNTYVCQGKRSCRTCSRAQTAAWKARQRTGVTVQRQPAVRRSVVFDRDRGVCGICGHRVDPTNWHLDHIVPRSKGGVHAYPNVQVAHPACNRHKHALL